MSENQFIANIKKKESSLQRIKLLDHYDKILKRIKNEKSTMERIRLLVGGLESATFAQVPLHKDLPNLKPIQFEVSIGSKIDNKLEKMEKDLLKKLEQGKRRAVYASFFSDLLEEWASTEDLKIHNEEERFNCEQSAIKKWLNVKEFKEPDLGFLEKLTKKKDLEKQFKTIKYSLLELTSTITQKVMQEEVKEHLNGISSSYKHCLRNRKLAIKTLKDTVLLNEYAGALTISLENLESVDWNLETSYLHTRTIWIKTKFRTYIDYGLYQTLLWNIIGERIGYSLKSFLQTNLDHPLKNKETSICIRKNSDNKYSYNIYSTSCTTILDHPVYTELFMGLLKSSLGSSSQTDYNMQSSSTKMTHFHRIIQLLSAKITTNKEVNPDLNYYVFGIDFKNYFDQFDHLVVEKILHLVGFPSDVISLINKFLKIPFKIPANKLNDLNEKEIEIEVEVEQEKKKKEEKEEYKEKEVKKETEEEFIIKKSLNGLPMNYTLSNTLSELIMTLLEVYVYNESEIRIIRCVDDMYICSNNQIKISKAYNAIQFFCETLGMDLNLDKLGFNIFTPKTEKLKSEVVNNLKQLLNYPLPENSVTWGYLILSEEKGKFIINNQKLFQSVDWLKERINKSNIPIITKVNLFNIFIKYYISLMAPMVRISRDHLQNIGKITIEIEKRLFNGNRFDTELIQNIKKRFQFEGEFPKALLYFPITAGGLGLWRSASYLTDFDFKYTFLNCRIFSESKSSQIVYILNSEDWEFTANTTIYFAYRALLQEIEHASPSLSSEQKIRVNDFISRGSEVGGTRRVNLNNYYQWIISFLGEDVISHFGTFRFLITQLVPMQIIISGRLKDTETTV
ncbi:hypothetical protein M0813_13619 [Anaeramoeba flamelloides]|uniref:Reverse transcriptase domain-containing protein n=1 Tax=Anaeramoeba flamelloides TaxID=1746091 RepID=A0ABQ8Z8U5_9EUKA|nr:hypothetical protein M0813_13619 [Anaeramoeba flamelloides]